MERPPTFDQTLAERLRQLRNRYDLSLEDLAAGARSLGLEWSRGTVWAIENGIDRRSGPGTRRLSVAEFLVLPAIFERAASLRGARELHFTLDDVMPRSDEIAIGALRLPQEALRQTLRGSSFNPDHFEDPDLREVEDIGSAENRVLRALAKREVPKVADEIQRWSRSPVDRFVARKLEAPPELVAIAGYLRWGESLAQLRNRMVEEKSQDGEPGSDAARRQRTAQRGHVTREILDDALFREHVELLRAEVDRAVEKGSGRARSPDASTPSQRRLAGKQSPKGPIAPGDPRFPPEDVPPVPE